MDTNFNDGSNLDENGGWDDDDGIDDHDTGFQIGAGLYAVGRPVQKKEQRGRPNRHQSIPAPRERRLIQPFFR